VCILLVNITQLHAVTLCINLLFQRQLIHFWSYYFCTNGRTDRSSEVVTSYIII